MTRLMKTTLTAIGLLLALPACAQQAAPAAKARAANDADPALWVVKDQDTTVYLFGTIHVLKPGLTWFDEAVKSAFDRSNEVKLELVLPDQAAMTKLVMATGRVSARSCQRAKRRCTWSRTTSASSRTSCGCWRARTAG